MAFGDGGQIVSGGSSGNNQTTLSVNTTAAVNAGEFVAIGVTVDNRTTGGGDLSDVTGVTIGGVALTLARQNAGNVAAQAGSAASLWVGQPGAIASGSAVVATFNNATTSDASGMSGRKFTVGAGNSVSKVGDNANSGTTTSPGSLDVTGANVEHLRIRVIGCEFDSTQALTVTTNWTGWTEGASAASGGATEQVTEIESRIVTGTNGASAPTLGTACDHASVYAAFVEVPPSNKDSMFMVM